MKNQPTKFLFVRDLTVSKPFTSLVSKLIQIYGEDLSVADLKKITPEEFAEQKGVKSATVDRFTKFKKILDGAKIKLPSLVSTSKQDEELLEPSTDDVSAITFDERIFDIELEQSGRRKKVENKYANFFKEGNSLLDVVVPAEELLEPEIIERAKRYKIAYFSLTKSERKVFSKYEKYNVPYEEMTPLFLLTIDHSMLKSLPGFGSLASNVLRGIHSRILGELQKDEPSGILILKEFDANLSLDEIEQILLEDLENFSSFDIPEKLLQVWERRLGYKTEFQMLAFIGREFGLTRERIRQYENQVTAIFVKGMRVSSEKIHEKIASMSRAQILNQFKKLRTAFCSDEAFFRFISKVAQIDGNDLV